MRKDKRDLPAIEGGKPVRSSFLPFYRPSIDSADVESVARTIRSGWLTLGPKTEEFERALEEYLRVRNVVAVSSCSEGMFLALKALGVGPGDEVITSALTFSSTVHAIIHTGARPVLADIDPETFGPSPEAIYDKVGGGVKAFLPVHFGGQACRLDDILRVAAEKGAFVVEDAAHAFGAEVGGTKLGAFSDATVFSFYATKNLTTGEGGCVSTNDETLAERIRCLSYHGMSRGAWSRYSERGSWYYEVEEPGHKSHLNDILSSLGLSQLRKIDRLLRRREEVAGRFLELLQDSPFFELPRVREGNLHTWHLFVVLLKLEKLKVSRNHFLKALSAENVGCSVHFIPVYKHPFYKPYLKSGDRFPVCEDFFSRCISIPIFADMEEGDVIDIVRALEKIASYYENR